MVKLEDAVIARIEHSGEKFEMLVDPYIAMDLKNGKEVSFDELLASDTVFKDANKGDVKSEDSIRNVFKTDDVKEIEKLRSLGKEVLLIDSDLVELPKVNVCNNLLI